MNQAVLLPLCFEVVDSFLLLQIIWKTRS